MKEFAQRLLAHELRVGKAGGNGAAAFRIGEKLRVSLGRLMGVAGFRSLFTRALAVASVEVPWLRELQIQADGTVKGLDELKSNLTEQQIAEGAVVLVAQFLQLLVTFIGPTLTAQLIHDVWPKADFSQFEF